MCEGMPPEPPALQFNVTFKSQGPRKKLHTKPKRSVGCNKWLVFNKEDRMLKAIIRDFLESR